MILTDHVLVHIRDGNNDQVRSRLVQGYISLSLLTWNPCIAGVINIRGYNYLPGSEARGTLGNVPIGLRATLCLIRQISV